MRKTLRVDKALQSIPGELVKDTPKLMKIDKHINKDSKKLNEVEDYPIYSEEQ